MCSCYACRVPIRARTAVSVLITRRPFERAHRSHRWSDAMDANDAMLATLVPQVDTRTSCDCDANMSLSNVTSAELRRVTHCRPAVLSFGAPVGNGRPAHICTGTASTLPHLHRDWAHPTHICAGTGLHCATSAPELGLSCPHLQRDWARPCWPAVRGGGWGDKGTRRGLETRTTCRHGVLLPTRTGARRTRVCGGSLSISTTRSGAGRTTETTQS